MDLADLGRISMLTQMQSEIENQQREMQSPPEVVQPLEDEGKALQENKQEENKALLENKQEGKQEQQSDGRMSRLWHLGGEIVFSLICLGMVSFGMTMRFHSLYQLDVWVACAPALLFLGWIYLLLEAGESVRFRAYLSASGPLAQYPERKRWLGLTDDFVIRMIPHNILWGFCFPLTGILLYDFCIAALIDTILSALYFRHQGQATANSVLHPLPIRPAAPRAAAASAPAPAPAPAPAIDPAVAPSPSIASPRSVPISVSSLSAPPAIAQISSVPAPSVVA